MSAIFGIIRFDGGVVADADLRRMGTAMTSRGPDGIGWEVLGSVGLGHCLMRINHEDRFERQPLDRDGLVISADARIDNREDLAKQLDISASRLATLPDSQVILAAYRHWGIECTDRLLGDFAFAVWDDTRRQLFIARDPIGMRGLYWYCGAGFAAFATEAKALTALPQIPRELDATRMMRSIVRDFRSGENCSPVKGLGTVHGGTYRRVGLDGSVHDERYWSPAPSPEHLGRERDYYHATYRSLTSEAVRCRVYRLNDPPGLLLSGGFDSAIIAALAAPEMGGHDHRLLAVTSAPVETPGGAAHEGDARPGAQWCLDHMPHLKHEWWSAQGESFLDAAGSAEHVSDDVPLQLGFVFDAMYASLRRRGARTAFDGIGGDETINPRVGPQLSLLWRSRQFRRLLSEVRAEARASSVSATRLIARTIAPAWLRGRAGGAVAPDGVFWTNRYCEQPLLQRMIAEGSVRLPERVAVGQFGARIRTLELLQSRARQNNANEAAAQGLELVRPMLDRRLIEFGLAIPDALQREDGRYRALARKALAAILPPQFATRPHGQEMLLPHSDTLMRANLDRMRADMMRWKDRPELVAHLNVEQILEDLAPENIERADAIQLAVLARMYLTARYVSWFYRFN